MSDLSKVRKAVHDLATPISLAETIFYRDFNDVSVENWESGQKAMQAVVKRFKELRLYLKEIDD